MDYSFNAAAYSTEENCLQALEEIKRIVEKKTSIVRVQRRLFCLSQSFVAFEIPTNRLQLQTM